MAQLVPRTVGGIVSVVAATLLYGFNWPLDNAGQQVEPIVRLYLQMEQARAVSARTGAAPEALTREQLEALVDATADARNISIASLHVRGSMMRAVARVEFDVNGAPPPDGRRVRYLRLGQTGLGGWMVDRTTNVLTYYFLF